MFQSISFSQALVGYELNIRARQLSINTVADYNNTFRLFALFIGPEINIRKITSRDITEFLAIQSERVGSKTIRNYHTGLSALWTWLVHEKIVEKHIVHDVPRPKTLTRVIIPFTEENIRAMLRQVGKSKPYTRPGKRLSTHAVEEIIAQRNRAIILLLVDTGMRASELANLKIYDLDPDQSIVKVLGKLNKERMLPFSAATAQAIWRYLTYRGKASLDAPLFITKKNRPVSRYRLGENLKVIGERAGVMNVHPHRFRHTFAIEYLRNGGDIFTLQTMLGHTTLDMVKTYLQIAQVDIVNAHKKASPVDHWHL